MDPPDEREPTADRQAELRATALRNRASGNPPYADATIFMLGELRWIMKENDWSSDIRRDANEQMRAPGVEQSGEIDAGGKFRANLSGAYMRGVNLSGAALLGANLSGAHMEYVNLADADLRGVSLIGTALKNGSLQRAVLRWADLRNVDARDANLCGSDLRGAQMDATTRLGNVAIDSHTLLADVVWNGAPLTQVSWEAVPQLGDERLARAEKRLRRRAAYRQTVRAYRGLEIALRSQGLMRDASKYRLREQRSERRLLFLERKFGEWFLSWLSDIIASYGEVPAKPFIIYFLVVTSFALAYFGLGLQVGQPFSPLGSVVFSVTSFHGRGFFPGEPLTLENPVTVLAAAEAVIGLFVEITLIATFSRRFLEYR